MPTGQTGGPGLCIGWGRSGVIRSMNQTAKVAAAVVAVVVVLGAVRIGIGLSQPQDDQKAIQKALDESLQASREGRPGGVLDLLSNDLKVNDQSSPASTQQIAKFIHDQKPDVTVENPKAFVSGDDATITSPVDLKLDFLGQNMSQRIDGVTLQFHKENAHAFLIFPTKKWVLTDVRVPQSALGNLTSF